MYLIASVYKLQTDLIASDLPDSKDHKRHKIVSQTYFVQRIVDFVMRQRFSFEQAEKILQLHACNCAR